MSIRKLLGTGACMIIIGVSAGVSYGQFQRLTAHVAPSEPAQIAAATAQTTPVQAATATPSSADFLTASVKTWTPAPASDVTQPQLIKPVAKTQPEPPLMQFSAHSPDAQSAVTPTLAPTQAVEARAPVVLNDVPAIATAAAATVTAPAAIVRKPTPAPRKVAIAATPNALPSPAQLRKNRLNSVASTSGDQDGTFEQQFAPRQNIQAKRPAALSAGTRAAQRVARFERIWVTGVYR